MSRNRKTDKTTVLIAEDDPDDRFLLEEAFQAYEEVCRVHFVEDGEELMDYLRHRGRYSQPAPPKPGLILLDLNMPKKDGWEALLEIKQHPASREIPIIVWTTSTDGDDRVFCEKAGVSDYVMKPNSYVELDAAIKGILERWLQLSPGA